MSGLGALRRLQTPPAVAPAEEVCEFCGEVLPSDGRVAHGHVADLVDHRLLCVCRPCYLLFEHRGAGGGRYRGVGTNVRRVDPLHLDEATWEQLKLPVGLAFLFTQTPQDASTPGSSGQAGDRPVAFYPSPAGATESELDLAAWSTIVADNPALGRLEADVEAALLRRRDDASGPSFSAHVVPIDLCYELVGVVRTHWIGLAGGAEVWRVIEEWFAALDARADLA